MKMNNTLLFINIIREILWREYCNYANSNIPKKKKIFSNQVNVFRGQATFMCSVKVKRLSNMQSLLHNIMVIVVCRVGSEHYSINKI